MEALKVKNGFKIVVIMENGKTIKNMGLEYKIMGIKIDMKVDGCKICVMEKVNFNLQLLYILGT